MPESDLPPTPLAPPDRQSGSAQPGFLAGLGWSGFFSEQLAPDEAGLLRARISAVHRTRLTATSESGQIRLSLPARASTAGFAVGDWVLADAETHLLHRRLERRTLISRRLEGSPVPQLTGANVDTLFIVTSCNADFNPARLERYLALANEAGTEPVMVLTKADTVDDADEFVRQAASLQRGLVVLTLNARSPEAAEALAPWCGSGRTVALIGSSGVGKSTLLNTLAGPGQVRPQETGAIREHDAKGRHTTTSRSLHAIAAGGWVIDSPGMRTLHLSDSESGIDTLFAEITELAPQCRFRDCTHNHEPGCAVLAAAADGRLDPDRLARWRKLRDENRENTPVANPRAASPAGRRRKR